MKTYTVILVDKIWKRGGKRKHRTFTVKAESKIEAQKIALSKFKLLSLNWTPAGAEAREVRSK